MMGRAAMQLGIWHGCVSPTWTPMKQPPSSVTGDLCMSHPTVLVCLVYWCPLTIITVPVITKTTIIVIIIMIVTIMFETRVSQG